MFSVLWHIRGSMVVIELISNQTDLQVGDGRGGSGRGCGRGGSEGARGGSERGGRALHVKMPVCRSVMVAAGAGEGVVAAGAGEEGARAS